ncbi:hypothetical protein PSA01_09930 [Pseudonocardia saturnea]|uniref:Uncharacterized protein n=1 Tax=Pseudonocardia saturnea TaxID=33909 RepID=A0ABQ0RUE5_9PSEU|nr:hypothetical protein Pdca_02540 [Pseudonocardia autotrophica]GEC23964.1 hypothetical protein PSA01_09930 [Pseudonocardia saturnea]
MTRSAGACTDPTPTTEETPPTPTIPALSACPSKITRQPSHTTPQDLTTRQHDSR